MLRATLKLPGALLVLAAAGAVAGLFALRAGAQAGSDVPTGNPAATVNLGTREGADLVKGEWRYSDTKIVEIDYTTPPPERKPIKTYSYTPHADDIHKPGFSDASWEVLDPTTLGKPRSTGKMCFNWYRINVAIPEKVGEFATTGSTVVFDTIVDDYGEVWVDGKLPRRVGQTGGTVAAGFNVANRLIIGKNVQPGQKIQISVFGINSPISATPTNWIFLRYAKLDFYK